MANKKLTDLTELTTPDDGDFLYIVDVSDTTESAQGTSKKIRKDKVDSGASKENIANKQNSLAIDGTGTKYPTVDAVNTIDLQKVLTNGTYAEFDGDSRNSAYFLDGNPFDRSVEFYLDNGISGSGNAGSVQINKNTAVEFQNYSGTKRGDIAIYGGNVEILQANIGTPGTTTVSFTNPTVNTSIKIPAKTAVGTYTLATTDETVNLTGDQTITGSKTFDNTQVILYGGASNPLYIQANIAGAYIENLSTNDGLKIENTSSGDALNINTTPFSTGKALVIKNNDVEKFSVSKNGYFNSQGGFINGILDFTNTDDVGLGQFYMNLNRFLFTNTSGNLQFLTQNSGFVTYKSPTISGTFSNANLTTNRTFTLPDATGTIPIVSQTITNGVTDKSPSEDAVFDAIDGVVKTIISDMPTSTLTGTLSETLIRTHMIPAGKLPTSCAPNIKVMTTKLGTAGTLGLRIRVNTTNNFATATLVALVGVSATTLGMVVNRTFVMQGGNLIHTNAANIVSDETSTVNATSTITYNPAVDQYWFFSLINGSTADTSQIRSIKMIN